MCNASHSITSVYVRSDNFMRAVPLSSWCALKQRRKANAQCPQSTVAKGLNSAGEPAAYGSQFILSFADEENYSRSCAAPSALILPDAEAMHQKQKTLQLLPKAPDVSSLHGFQIKGMTTSLLAHI